MNNLEYVQDVQTEGQLYKEKQGEKPHDMPQLDETTGRNDLAIR